MSGELDAERLAVLVHEVRSPVAALAAIAETFADAELDEAARPELVRLAISAARSSASWPTSRSHRSASRSRPRPRARCSRRRGARRDRVQVVAAELPLIEGDPQRLRQALDNLIANAVLHSGSTAQSSCRQGRESLRISVSDAGDGIPPEEQERIFDIGVRLGDGGGSGSDSRSPGRSPRDTEERSP